MMAHFDFYLEFETNGTSATGIPITTFELVVSISDSVRGVLKYPMTVKYTDGMVLHEVDKLKREISDDQLRRDLIISMKNYVKSQFE